LKSDFSILVVDDEPSMRELIRTVLSKEGYPVTEADGGNKALSLMEEGGFALVISDIKMPDMGGMELLRRIKEVSPSTQAILITAYGSVENAVEAMKVGATDYLTKPFKIDELKLAVSRILNEKRLSEENSYLRQEIGQRYGLDNFIARSSAMSKVLEEVGSVAPTDATVLLRGESGTGKELIARAIHNLSRRREGIFVAVNCAALTETLLESELFGHEKGAFTGAISQKKGRFEIADGGTLFLDEVGDMSPAMQAKLLRALQEQAFERVGGTRTIKVDVRIIAATNRDLEGAIKGGKFREDLYYRLNVMSIRIPPLRERSECIIPLAEFFLDRFGKSLGKGVRKLSPEAVGLLLKHTSWNAITAIARNVRRRNRN